MTESELRVTDVFGAKVRCIGDPAESLLWLRVADVADLLPDLDIITLFKEGVIAKDELRVEEVDGRDVPFLFESGFYTLCMLSDVPEAQKFQKWILRDVLPKIAKSGLK